jgi:hypothetical protein
MRKALKLMAVLAAFGLTAWIGVVALAQGSSAPTQSTSTTTTGPTGGDDVKGNCDEAEHANDPECVGVNPVPENEDKDDQGDVNDDDQGENENNDDQGENEDNDDQGENDDDQGEDHGDDDQGGNSGSGSENSGPGSEESGSGS